MLYYNSNIIYKLYTTLRMRIRLRMRVCVCIRAVLAFRRSPSCEWKKVMLASLIPSNCLALYQHRQRYNDQCWKPKTSVTPHEVHTIRQHRFSHQKRAQLVFPAPVSRVIRVPSLLAPVFRGSAVFLLGIGLDNVAAGNFKCR